jgi:hypothetical protein
MVATADMIQDSLANVSNDGSDEQLPLWARRAGIGPSLDQCPKLLLRPRRGFASCPRMPAQPTRLSSDICAISATISRPPVLDLLANFTERFALPSHLDWRKVPFWITGNVCRIVVLLPMTGVDAEKLRRHRPVKSPSRVAAKSLPFSRPHPVYRL